MKAKAKPKDVDEYLAAVPEPARSTLKHVRAVIRSVVPAGTTEVISYGIPTFRYKRGLVAFAAFSNHCSFFPLGASALDCLRKSSKSSASRKARCTFRWTSLCRTRW